MDCGRPRPCTVPVILPFAHHMRVTWASDPSTVPRQMHMSGLMSTLVRTMVIVVLSAKATVIFAGWLVPSGFLTSIVRACSSTAGGGARMILTPTVALDALA